ncbi:MAG: FHA domain-containing protein [Pseudomonadota bacterium]
MAKLIVVSGSTSIKEFNITKDQISIGRTAENDIALDSVRVSRKHAIIKNEAGIISVIDNQSSNGTLVNGEKINERVLAENDKIIIGEYIFKIVDLRQAGTGSSEDGFEMSGNGEAEEEIIEEKKSLKEILSRVNILDWKYKTAILIGLYILFTHSFITDYLIKKGTRELFIETHKRAQIIAKYLAQKNQTPLMNHNDILLDVATIKQEQGVKEAYIADTRLRIRAPSASFGQTITDAISKEALYQDKLVDDFPDYQNLDTFLKNLNTDSSFILSTPIKVWDEQNTKFRTIGIAKIVYYPLEIINNHMNRKEIQKEGFVIGLIPALIIFLGIYFFTVFPIRRARNEIEDVIKGLKSSASEKLGFSELSSLIESANRAIEKAASQAASASGSEPSLSSSSLGSQNFYESSEWETIINYCKDGLIILDPNNTILLTNHSALTLLKLPGNGGKGDDVFDTIENSEILDILKSQFELIADNIDEPAPDELEFGGPGSIIKIQSLAIKESFGQIIAKILLFSQE